MTAYERDVLQAFLRQVQQDRPLAKDPVADSMIASALASQPDALYLLVQRAIAAELALQRLPAAAPTCEPLPASAPVPQAGALRAAGQSSFLGTAASVAAGVVAGGFLVEGLKAVMQDTGMEDALGQGLDGFGGMTDWV